MTDASVKIPGRSASGASAGSNSSSAPAHRPRQHQRLGNSKTLNAFPAANKDYLDEPSE